MGAWTPRTSRLTRTPGARWLLVVAVALVGLASTRPLLAQASSESWTVHHVLATGNRQPQEKPTFDRALEPFRSKLERYRHRAFKHAGTKELKLGTDSTEKLPLPDKLGTMTIHRDSAGKVSFELKGKTKEQKFGMNMGPRDRVIIYQDKFRTQSGAQYILILMKKKPKS